MKRFLFVEKAHPIIEWRNMPHLVGDRYISPQALQQRFDFVGESAAGWYVYRQLSSGVFVAGPLTQQGLSPKLEIYCHASDKKVIKNRHVVFVDSTLIKEEEAGRGHTRRAYETICQHYTLISDRIHYKGAMFLWKSLATSTLVNIYVWDNLVMDWLRDAKQKPIRYNGTNIPYDAIWGTNPVHADRLLVAASYKITR